MVGQIRRALFQQVLQQLASVFKEGLPKAQLDGFQIAKARAFPLLTDQPQESPCFSELLLGNLRRLEFFLACV